MKIQKSTLITMIILALLSMVVPASLAQENDTMTNTITVTGTGSAESAPDMATLSVGVELSGEDILSIYGDVNTAIANVTAALEELGIADEDMRTAGLDVFVSPTYFEGPARNETRISNRINITIRDLSQIENVIDTAISNGANTVFGLQFGISDADALEAEARVNALDDARSRAEALASNLGVELGSVVTVIEGNNGGGFFGVGNNAMMDMSGGGAVIEPGRISVSLSVQITYRFDS